MMCESNENIYEPKTDDINIDDLFLNTNEKTCAKQYAVYAIGNTDYNNIIKIGYSGNVLERFKTIDLASHESKTIYGLFECANEEDARKYEKAYHCLFSSFRIKGEWFALNIEQINEYFPKYHPLVGHCSPIVVLPEEISAVCVEQKLDDALKAIWQKNHWSRGDVDCSIYILKYTGLGKFYNIIRMGKVDKKHHHYYPYFKTDCVYSMNNKYTLKCDNSEHVNYIYGLLEKALENCKIRDQWYFVYNKQLQLLIESHIQTKTESEIDAIKILDNSLLRDSFVGSQEKISRKKNFSYAIGYAEKDYNIVKIGCTKNVTNMLSNMRKTNPNLLLVLYWKRYHNTKQDAIKASENIYEIFCK